MYDIFSFYLWVSAICSRYESVVFYVTDPKRCRVRCLLCSVSVLVPVLFACLGLLHFMLFCMSLKNFTYLHNINANISWNSKIFHNTIKFHNVKLQYANILQNSNLTVLIYGTKVNSIKCWSKIKLNYSLYISPITEQPPNKNRFVIVNGFLFGLGVLTVYRPLYLFCFYSLLYDVFCSFR